MRGLLTLLAIVAGLYLFLAPARADAATPETFRDYTAAKHSRAPEPKGPVEQPEDWIAVAGIVCYAIIPAVLVIAIGVVGYELWIRNADSALLVSRDAWIYRGAASRSPPGLVLLSF